MSRQQLLANVRKLIEKEVAPFEFVKTEPDLWRRDCQWKADRVELIAGDDRKPTFFINLYVILPPRPGSKLEFNLLSFKNLPAVAGRLDTAYHYSDSRDHLLAQIVDDLANVNPWFTQFDSPQKCLKYVQQSKDKNPHSLAYKYCVDYLSSL